jgi:sialic acid synthase SpsE
MTSDILLLGASLLGATFLESTFIINKFNETHLLDNEWQFDQLIDVVNNIKSVNAARGGYEARKITKVEKKMMKQ